MKLVVFVQDSCGPCNSLKIHLKALQQLMTVEIVYIDITDNWDIAEVFGFSSTPAVFRASGSNADVVLTTIHARTTLALMKELGESVGG